MINRFEHNLCPSDEIAAYIDGELSHEQESELESHFAACTVCSTELTYQRQFLCGLSSSLKDEREMELPPDFAKKIVAHAESSVAGLRRPSERFNAIFICVGLSLFVLFATGAESSKVIAGVSSVVEKISAVGAFLGHIFYSLLLGVIVIIRSLAIQFQFDSIIVAIFAGFAAVAAMYFSRRLLKIRRA